ncbi:MAG TPA: tetratricopeptide repeat protein [Verrucomicrobiae bacterium]|nr:tetratricopeptide repeat protein [Verrucomicrobiae bacterium]
MSGDNRTPNKDPGHFWAFVDRVVCGFISICRALRKNWGRFLQWIGKRWGIDAERVLGKLAVRTGLVLVFVLCVVVLYSGVGKSLLFVRSKLNTITDENTPDDVGDFYDVLLSAAIVGVVFFAFNKQRQRIDRQQTEIHSIGQKIQALTDALDEPRLASELPRFLKPDFEFWFLPTPDDQIAAYRLVTKLKPDDPKAYCNLALACGRHGKHDDAVAACKKAIALKPNDPMLWFSLGLVYRHQSKHHDAMAAYRQVFKVQPDFLAAWYLNAGQYPKADRNYDAIDAVELNPSWVNLALTSEYQDNAIAAYRQEIKLQPDDPYAWHGLGWTYFAQGKYSESIGASRQAVTLKPHLSEAWFILGLAYGRQGDQPEALDALDHLRKLDPTQADKLAGLLSSK